MLIKGLKEVWWILWPLRLKSMTSLPPPLALVGVPLCRIDIDLVKAHGADKVISNLWHELWSLQACAVIDRRAENMFSERDVRKTGVLKLCSVRFLKTEPSKNLTSVQTVFRQKLLAIHHSNKQELSYRKQIARQLRTQFVEGISVTLKSTLRVNQGHWKRNHWTDHIRLSSSRVIKRWILLWPWNVG